MRPIKGTKRKGRKRRRSPAGGESQPLAETRPGRQNWAPVSRELVERERREMERMDIDLPRPPPLEDSATDEEVQGWFEASRRTHREAIQRGLDRLRNLPPWADLREVASCLPYRLSVPDARDLARILLALGDPKVPADAKTLLREHRDRLLKVREGPIIHAGEVIDDGVAGLLDEARPSPPSGRRSRLAREIRSRFPSLYEELIRRLRESSPLTLEETRHFIKSRLPHWSGRINVAQTEKLKETLQPPYKKKTIKKKAIQIMADAFTITPRLARKWAYGGEKKKTQERNGDS